MTKPKIIQAYDYVHHPYELVRDHLSKDALAVFSNATNSAAERVETVAAELRVNIAGIEIGKDIDVTIHNVIETPGDAENPPITTIQFKWKAANNPRLFPYMTAEIKIIPLTDAETKIDFFGSYDPPLWKVGSGIDAVVGYRVAEACVLRFVRDIATYLREELSRGEAV